ncbi:MAG TPA: GntR family transcriptional regulator [Longimicrobium sp.]|nr:GntR family transcriptional regulator [Longimicrobium sp.]
MNITRVPLREQVHRAIVGRILREEIAAGSRVSDSVLAQELGVSRTPVREALLRMEREGFLEVDVGRGFFVKPLSAGEVAEVYPVLWTLEVLALRTAGPDAGTVAELDRINGELADAGDDPERRIELDVAWHQALLAGCENRLLLEMIARLKAVIRRYEYAYMQNAVRVPVSTRTHHEIARALERGDIEAAVPLLESNWRFTMEELLPWVQGER